MEPRGRAHVRCAQLLARDRQVRRQAAFGAGVGGVGGGSAPLRRRKSTRKAQNLAVNPNVVAHSESGENVVIVEGVAQVVTDPALQEFIDDAYEAKYGVRHGTPVWVLEPRVVHAWSRFPADATRWVFGRRSSGEVHDGSPR